MICPPSAANLVVAAAVAAHPYEEPLVVVEQGGIARNSSRWACSRTRLRDDPR